MTAWGIEQAHRTGNTRDAAKGVAGALRALAAGTSVHATMKMHDNPGAVRKVRLGSVSRALKSAHSPSSLGRREATALDTLRPSRPWPSNTPNSAVALPPTNSSASHVSCPEQERVLYRRLDRRALACMSVITHREGSTVYCGLPAKSGLSCWQQQPGPACTD